MVGGGVGMVGEEFSRRTERAKTCVCAWGVRAMMSHL
jgi:hypothetical protein